MTFLHSGGAERTGSRILARLEPREHTVRPASRCTGADDDGAGTGRALVRDRARRIAATAARR
ncbi:hypothetical protein GTU71_08125 [Rathayibacter sp. VKM Ac-2762]|uniref:hypothetical protein n=1 Tax=Rathayibacter sp. VKM Ac-2762 TaxID=2609254 RepID=UPI00132EA24E|nr:hypothetical protein [Rathayibacter sp. VKM Ac-2762]QHF20810.1 hypothetical protein GTU71_08125 [Rathayibacter sp. VKM Ac-2762]